MRTEVLQLATGDAMTIDHPYAVVHDYVWAFTEAANHLIDLRDLGDSKTLVTKIAAAPPREHGTRGRPHSVTSIEAQLARIPLGETENLGDANYYSVSAIASSMKARRRGAFSVTQNEQRETVVRRIDGVVFQQADGTTRGADMTLVRGRYPFKAMVDGDAYRVPADQHNGLQAMREICRRKQKARGWGFTPALNDDGSVTIYCHIINLPPEASKR